MDSPTALALAIETTAHGDRSGAENKGSGQDVHPPAWSIHASGEVDARASTVHRSAHFPFYLCPAPFFSSSNVPGMLVACGRHGRRPPWVIDA